MRLLLTFIIAAIGTTDAFAEARYDTNFHLELKSVGLEREAFLYGCCQTNENSHQIAGAA